MYSNSVDSAKQSCWNVSSAIVPVDVLASSSHRSEEEDGDEEDGSKDDGDKEDKKTDPKMLMKRWLS